MPEVPSYRDQMNRVAYRPRRMQKALYECIRGRPKRFECLHLHHPMPTSGRNPHRPLIFFRLRTFALNHNGRQG